MALNRLFGKFQVESVEKLEADYGPLLGPQETIETGFRVIRDTFVFTSNRLIIVDVQGITGKKREFTSIPYSKITMYSLETTGNFDLDADLKIWVGSFREPIERKFTGDSNVYELQRVLASHIS